MASYVTITDSQVDPEAPITSELMSSLRDNPLAIAEAAAGAPKIDPTALDTTLSGPVSASRSASSGAGTTVFLTVTDLDAARVLFISSLFTMSHPTSEPNSGSLRYEVSSNNGSSWAYETIISDVTVSSVGSTSDLKGLVIPMQGFNAVRFKLVYTTTGFNSSISVSDFVLTGGSY